jgi:hypothetical protein
LESFFLPIKTALNLKGKKGNIIKKKRQLLVMLVFYTNEIFWASCVDSKIITNKGCKPAEKKLNRNVGDVKEEC